MKDSYLVIPLQAKHIEFSKNILVPNAIEFTKENSKNTQGDDHREEPHSNQTSPAEQLERNILNFWFLDVMKVNEHILESLLSLHSNDANAEQFWAVTNEIRPA